MKKSIICLFVGMLFIVACSKEELSESTGLPNVEEPEMVLDNIPLIKNPCDISLYLESSEDEDDERIVFSLYEIGVLASDIIGKGELNQKFINAAKNNINNTYNLNDLKLENTLKSTSICFDQLVDKIDKIDLTRRAHGKLKSGEIEDYLPAIYIPNADIADYNKKPLICPGVLVNSEVKGAEEYDEYIVAWYYDENDNKQEIIINEETALKTTNPVLIFDNASIVLSEPSSTEIKNSEQVRLKSTTTTGKNFWATHEFQLNERHESSGNSDFWITAGQINEDGNYLYTWTDYNLWYTEAEIAQVDPDDIGTQLEAWFNFCNTDVEPYTDNYVFFNTFERDWYRSKKSLGNATGNGVTIYLDGNMHYSTDWYGFEQANINDSKLDFAYIYSNWAKWYESNNSKLCFWRCEF